MNQNTIGVIGSINVDLLVQVMDLPSPGHTVHGWGGTLSPGGKGANQALAAARQGARVIMIGAVGEDPHADVALEYLVEADVELEHIKRVEGPTGLAVVAVDHHGENNIIVISGANAAVSPEMVDESLVVLRECSWVVLQGEIPVETTDHAIAVLADAGTRVILNLAPVIGILPESIRKVDLLVVNEYEAAQALELLGVFIETQEFEPVKQGQFLCQSLLEAGLASVIVTLGSHGAIAADSGGFHSLPALQVPVVDTTGAGDALVGAVAAGLAAGMSLVDACILGIRVGGATVQLTGAQKSYPWK